MPLTEKIRRADHVVWNNGGLGVLKEQARLLVDLWRDGRRPSQNFGMPSGRPSN